MEKKKIYRNQVKINKAKINENIVTHYFAYIIGGCRSKSLHGT